MQRRHDEVEAKLNNLERCFIHSHHIYTCMQDCMSHNLSVYVSISKGDVRTNAYSQVHGKHTQIQIDFKSKNRAYNEPQRTNMLVRFASH